MPLRHQGTKTNKVLKFKALWIIEILCFSALVARIDLLEWVQYLIYNKQFNNFTIIF
jgi:sugar phosphate permease